MRKGIAVLLASSVLLAALPGAAIAAPGDLDSTCGTGGIVTNQSGGAVDMAVQSDDGKIVLAGSKGSCTEVDEEYVCQSEFLVERFTAGGTLDSSFGGGDGIVTTSFGNKTQAGCSVLIEPTGKILVGGTTYNEATETSEFAVARYNSDGTADTSFGGGDGRATAAVPGSEEYGLRSYSGSLAETSAGTIVAGGGAFVESDSYKTWHLALAGFTADGEPDPSFGSGGIAIGPIGQIYGIAADSTGRILTAGWDSAYDFAVTRFTAAGSLDSGFGEGGVASFALSQTGSKADDVLVQPDGKIVASGYGFGYAVGRFNEDGTPDPTFGGGDGVVMTFFGQPCCGLGAAISEALQADGKIVFAGQWTADEDTFGDEWGIGRLFPDGRPDESFGAGGLVTQDFGSAPGEDKDASGVAIQSDGKILAVGSTGSPDYELGMLRLMGGGNAPEPLAHHLLIAKSGQGSGGVYGPDMLNCGANCGVDYEVGETVEIDAFPEGGSSFDGWTTTNGDPGTCTGMTTPCKVTLDEDVELVASFKTDPKPKRTLSVAKTGAGSGTVTSTPTGIDCGAACSSELDEGTEVTLTATPAPGSIFTGWSGASCFGTGLCEVRLWSDTHLTANFALEPGEEESGGEEEHAEQPPSGSGGSTLPTPTVAVPATTPVAAPPAPPAPRPLHCRKGFKKQRNHGKSHCVKIKKKRRHRRG
jgi:uncharacterized delta-60 repeat protein